MFYLNNKNGLEEFVNYDIYSLVTVFNPNCNVSSVAESAFKNDNSINAINFPVGLEEIGKSAFEDCSNLSVVLIGVPIPKWLFLLTNRSKKSKSKKKTKARNNITLQHNCFKNCSKLDALIINGYDTIKIEKGVFSGCSNLRVLDIDSAKLEISDDVFMDVDKDNLVIMIRKKSSKIEMICRENDIKCKLYTYKIY